MLDLMVMGSSCVVQNDEGGRIWFRTLYITARHARNLSSFLQKEGRTTTANAVTLIQLVTFQLIEPAIRISICSSLLGLAAMIRCSCLLLLPIKSPSISIGG